ncbi:hypothetical protein BKA81DRAFT_115683 [Phyllosticta paracitricarpa]
MLPWFPPPPLIHPNRQNRQNRHPNPLHLHLPAEAGSTTRNAHAGDPDRRGNATKAKHRRRTKERKKETRNEEVGGQTASKKNYHHHHHHRRRRRRRPRSQSRRLGKAGTEKIEGYVVSHNERSLPRRGGRSSCWDLLAEWRTWDTPPPLLPLSSSSYHPHMHAQCSPGNLGKSLLVRQYVRCYFAAGRPGWRDGREENEK